MYITENITKCYGVTFQINGCVKVQKFEDISNDENIIYCMKPMRIFLGKSQACIMTISRELLKKNFFDVKLLYLKYLKKMENINMYILVVI